MSEKVFRARFSVFAWGSDFPWTVAEETAGTATRHVGADAGLLGARRLIV